VPTSMRAHPHVHFVRRHIDLGLIAGSPGVDTGKEDKLVTTPHMAYPQVYPQSLQQWYTKQYTTHL